MGVAKGWVGRWVAFLRVRVDSVLSVRHRDQAALSPGSTGPTRLCTRKLRRALAVMCTKHENNQHAHCSRLSPSPFYFFFVSFRYQRLQSTPMVSGSQTFPADLDKCKQAAPPRVIVSHLRRFHSLLGTRHTPCPCHSWDAVS